MPTLTKRTCTAFCAFAIAIFCALAHPSLVNLADADVEAKAAEAMPVADPSPLPPSLMENLGRGVVALRTSATQVVVRRWTGIPHGHLTVIIFTLPAIAAAV